MSVLRRKKVLANINKDKLNLAEQPLPNAKRYLFGEDFPSVASKQAEVSRGLAKNLSNISKPRQPFQKSGFTKDRQRPKTTGTFSKYQANLSENNRSSFVPTRDPQTKTQQFLRKVETNHFRPRNPKRRVGIPNPSPLCSCSTTRSGYNIFRFISSPCRCRSEQTSFMGAIKKIPFSKVNFYSRLSLVPKKKDLIAR